MGKPMRADRRNNFKEPAHAGKKKARDVTASGPVVNPDETEANMEDRSKKSTIVQQKSDALPKATHQSVIQVGPVSMDCYVLEGGRRLLAQRSILRGIHATEDANFDRQIARIAKDSSGLRLATEVRFTLPQGGIVAIGRDPAFLIDLCRVLQRKLIAGELRQSQRHLGLAAAELIDALAGVGLESLIDAACGYVPKESRQDALDRWLRRDRNLDERTILPEGFMVHICRLYGHKYEAGQRPPKLMVGIAGNFYRNVLGEEKYAEFKAACDQDIVRADGLRSEMFQKLASDALGFMQSKATVAEAFAKTSRTPEEFWARFSADIRGTALQMHFGF